MTIYQILGVNEDVTIDEVRAAYAKKLKNIDMSKNIEDYRELREAYNKILKILNSRETYHYEDIHSYSNIKKEVNIPSSTSRISSIKKEQIKQEDNQKSVKEEPLKKMDALNETPKTSSLPENLSQFVSHKSFYNDLTGWSNLLTPFLNESKEQTKTTIKLFLLQNYKLLEDHTRLHLIHLCDITEQDYDSGEDKRLFREKIKQENFLNYDFFEKINKDYRNQYFKSRYQLHDFIQVDDSEVSVLITDIKDLKSFQFQDDDLLYFFSVYDLIENTSPNFSEIMSNFNKISHDKYRHDIEILTTYTHVLEGKINSRITKADIESLSWVSTTVKLKLIKQLQKKETPPDKNQRNSHVKRVNKNKKKKEKKETDSSFLKKIPSLIFGGIILVSIASSVLEDTSFFSNNDDDITSVSSEEDRTELLNYKNENRQSNLSLNYKIYSYLFEDANIVTNKSASFTDSVIAELEQFKKDNLTSIQNLNITNVSDMKKVAHETHYFSDNQQMISYTTFDHNKDFSIKTTFNKDNIMTKLEAINAENLPENLSLGTYDATKFFKEDLINNYDQLERYLSDLDKLHETYLTDNAYKMLQNMDEDMYYTISNFTFNTPTLLEIPNSDKKIIALTYNREFLFIELNNENKIDTFYSSMFESTPEDVLKQAEKINMEQSENDPWQFELG